MATATSTKVQKNSKEQTFPRITVTLFQEIKTINSRATRKKFQHTREEVRDSRVPHDKLF